jgi:hypothetical protein
MMPLRQVVEFVPSSSPQVLKRQALQRRVAIYAGVRAALPATSTPMCRRP